MLHSFLVLLLLLLLLLLQLLLLLGVWRASASKGMEEEAPSG